MKIFVQALLLALALPLAASHNETSSCAVSLDCWLNGDCVSGACICDPAWTGPTCAILVQRPATQLYPPPDPLPANTAALPSSWGSTIVRDDEGVFHMFVEVVCRGFTWMHIAGSVVVHATAPSLEGPFTFSDVALPQQSMTPHIVRDTDGAWLLLHQRNVSVVGDPECTGEQAAAGFAAAVRHGGSGAAPWRAAAASANPPNSTSFDGPPSIARATSLFGPWIAHDIAITPPPGRIIDNPNPSLLPLPGGGYLLAYTSRPAPPAPYSEGVGLAFAHDWRGGVFTSLAPPPADTLLDCEDPFLYRTDRGLHIVCHRRAPAPEKNLWNFTDVGGYGVSVDGGASWAWCPTPIFTTTVCWGGGGAAGAPLQFGRRERPEFLLGADGRPQFLTSGVEFVTGVLGNPSLSILVPLGPPPPPRPPPSQRPFYSVTVGEKSPQPILSLGLPVGKGHSPCNLTFNPAFLPARPPGLNTSIAIVRVSGCPAEYGGAQDHLMFAECEEDGSACKDLNKAVFPFEYLAEDPRIFFNEDDGMWYLFYFANGTNQSTVFLRRTATPLDLGSWELLASALPWHRNGCAFKAADGKFYVLYGETYANAYPGH